MALVIKKRVSLEFLGDEYKDSYIIVGSISVGDYDKLGEKTVKQVVSERFIEGEIQQDDGKIKITKENLDQLPGEVFVEAFGAMTGAADPKVEGLLKNQSLTTSQPLEN